MLNQKIELDFTNWLEYKISTDRIYGTNTAFIEIDNAKKEVTLLWEPLRGKYDVIVPMRTQSRQEQIYNHFKWALNQADRLWKLDQVFKKMNK